MKASKFTLFFNRKRIDDERSLEILNIRSGLVEGEAPDKFEPQPGMVCHVQEEDKDFQFDGEEWKPVNKKKFILIWVLIGAVAAGVVGTSVALPIALTHQSHRSGPSGPGGGDSSSQPGASSSQSDPQSSEPASSSSEPGSLSSDSGGVSSDSVSEASSDSDSSQEFTSESSSEPATFLVKFDSKGGTPVADVEVDPSAKVAAPEDPSNGELLFGGWYTEEKPSVASYYDFDSEVTADLTLYAHWVQPYVYTFNDDEGRDIYVVSDNEEYRVDNVVIPGVYKGIPVTRVDWGFCSNNDIMKTLVFEEGVEAVDCDAFSSCPNLESVTFANTMEEFREGAFYQFTPASVHFPASVKHIGSYTFTVCDNLTELTFEDSLTTLEIVERNFTAPNLKTVKLPEGLIGLGPEAFCNSGVETVYLPSTLNEVASGLFSDALQKVYSKVNPEDIETIWDFNQRLFQLDWYLYAEGGVAPENKNGNFYYFDESGNVVEFTIDTYPITISFDSMGGSEVAPLNPAYGEAMVLPTPAKDGWGFDAWYRTEKPSYTGYVPDGTKAKNSMDLYASWIDPNITFGYIDYMDEYNISGSDADIVNATIPMMYHGREIDRVGNEAFKGRLSLKSVTFEGDSETWNTIGVESFYGCTNLEYLVFKGKLSFVSTEAFAGCTSLSKVYETYSYNTYFNYGNDLFIQAEHFLFTENGNEETKTGKWWYYDADNKIVEVVNS